MVKSVRVNPHRSFSPFKSPPCVPPAGVSPRLYSQSRASHHRALAVRVALLTQQGDECGSHPAFNPLTPQWALYHLLERPLTNGCHTGKQKICLHHVFLGKNRVGGCDSAILAVRSQTDKEAVSCL